MRILTALTALIMVVVSVSASVTNRPDTVVYQPAGADTIAVMHDLDSNPYRFRWSQVAVPASIIATGVACRQFGWFRGLNDVKPHGSKKPHGYLLDDLIQYTPLAVIYALRLSGMRGMHNYSEMTILSAMSLAISAATVYVTKHAINTWRPDGSDHNSFPSGHTSTAFMGAELLRLEYRDRPWIGVAGYAVATATATLRVCHNRHWLSDALAGAGIGILSTHAAYWLYPVVTRAIFPRLYRDNIYIAPAVNGVALSLNF